MMVLSLTIATVSAQNLDFFEFVDKDGNVVPDGTTITLTEVTAEEDVFTGELSYIMYSNLSLRNKTADEHSMRVSMVIDRIDNGMYQLCFPMYCRTFSEVGNIVTESGDMMGAEIRDLMTEWLVGGETGGCDVKLSVEVMNKSGSVTKPNYTFLGTGPTVTLHYRNGIVDVVPGDVNGDQAVDVSDINEVINVMLGRTENVRADITGEGSVDVSDINAVVNIMLGK